MHVGVEEVVDCIFASSFSPRPPPCVADQRNKTTTTPRNLQVWERNVVRRCASTACAVGSWAWGQGRGAGRTIFDHGPPDPTRLKKPDVTVRWVRRGPKFHLNQEKTGLNPKFTHKKNLNMNHVNLAMGQTRAKNFTWPDPNPTHHGLVRTATWGGLEEKVYITPSSMRGRLHNPQPMKRSVSPTELCKTDQITP
jgi:hypothetical protein